MLIFSLAIVPVLAWLVWFRLWNRSGTSLIVLTCTVGFVSYLLVANAIWSDSAVWADALLRHETDLADSDLENLGKRRLASFTQLTLPFATFVWFAVVFCVGAALEHVLIRFGFESVGCNSINSRAVNNSEQSISCSNCGQSFNVSSALSGLVGACPHCKTTITFPDSSYTG